jgi:hypothetical protein
MSSKILAVLGSLGSLAICMARFVASGKRSPHAVVTKQEPKIRELTHPARQTADVKSADLIQTEPRTCLRISGLTKTEAEELLDWLENRGVQDCQVAYVEGQGFTVWRDQAPGASPEKTPQASAQEPGR